MLRNDDAVHEWDDWRTMHRIRAFNIKANEIMADQFDVLKTFSSTLALNDKLCDTAHYTGTFS